MECQFTTYMCQKEPSLAASTLHPHKNTVNDYAATNHQRAFTLRLCWPIMWCATLTEARYLQI